MNCFFNFCLFYYKLSIENRIVYYVSSYFIAVQYIYLQAKLEYLPHIVYMSQPARPANKQSGQQPDQNLIQFNRFLQNNNELLQQKYKQHFVKDKIKITAKDPNPDTIVKFISDVFSFDKNEEEGPQNKVKIQTNLKNNYESFLKRNKDIKQFSADVAIQLLKFCIQSNQMFAVQYESSKQSLVVESNTKNNVTQEKQIQNLKKIGENEQNEEQEANPQNIHQDLQSEQQNSNQSNQFAHMNNGFNSEASSPTKKKYLNTFDQMDNQFNSVEQIKLDLDPILVKKNIKIVFEYYCKQQMSLAPNLSFDRIQRQSHMMTMGKMLLMARMMNMLNSTLTKDFLVNKFRKIAEGKKQIDFKKFDILMSQLHIQDPTLIARAQLNNPNIHVYLKTNKKPFDTQDMLPRQLVKNRIFVNKITAHSGKMEDDLVQDLKTKKSCILPQKNSEKFSKIKKYYEDISLKAKQRYDRQIGKQNQIIIARQKSNQIINPKSLSKIQRKYSQDLSAIKIRKIITVEHQDDKWLGQYKINVPIRKAQDHDNAILGRQKSFDDKQNKNAVLIKDIRNRIRQIQQTQRQTSSFEQTKPFLVSPGRRY